MVIDLISLRNAIIPAYPAVQVDCRNPRLYGCISNRLKSGRPEKDPAFSALELLIDSALWSIKFPFALHPEGHKSLSKSGVFFDQIRTNGSDIKRPNQ